MGSYTQVGLRGKYRFRDSLVDLPTDIKATVIMLDLNDPDAKEDQREACIQSYLEQVPIPTGVEHDTFDYVQSRSIYAPIKDPNMVNIQLADLGSGTARIWCVVCSVADLICSLLDGSTSRRVLPASSSTSSRSNLPTPMGHRD